jgi:hypothetical protein
VNVAITGASGRGELRGYSQYSAAESLDRWVCEKRVSTERGAQAAVMACNVQRVDAGVVVGSESASGAGDKLRERCWDGYE